MTAEAALAVLLGTAIIAFGVIAAHLIRVAARHRITALTAAAAERYANDPDNAVRQWLWPERN